MTEKMQIRFETDPMVAAYLLNFTPFYIFLIKC